MTQKKHTDTKEKGYDNQQTCSEPIQQDACESNESGANATESARDQAGSESVSEQAVSPEAVKAEMMERILRLQADFDNYRRRTRQEQSELGAFVTQNLIREFLPVVDNFERALSSRPAEDPSGFGAGVEMIFRQLFGVLEKQGVSPVGTVGEMFDPNRHEAILKDEDSNQPEGMIVAELQKGYAVGGKVIRPALVKVAGK